jgi:serine/threonine-protein kinase RsbW
VPEGASASQPAEGRLVCRTCREDVEIAERRVLELVERFGYDRASCFAVRLALVEALNNATVHGNKLDPAKSVTLDYRIDSASVFFTVEDQGGGFDPASVPDPTASENVEIPSGRGIVLMRAYMTEVTFHPPGNRVSMIYRRQAG